MAMETLVVGKFGNASTPVELIKGDNYTQKIMMRVPRYFGGVDLAPLAWSVTVENAAGATDEYALSAIRGEDAIEMEWIPGGTATAVPGITKFKLSGFGEDRNILVWQSGTYHIRVKDTFSHTPGSETAAKLTEVQKLIIYVDGELNRVIKAADAAEAAAEAANRAADRAEGTANGTRIAALEKFTTEPENYSVTGNMVQLDNYSGMPMHCVTHIEPVQAGSGDPSPSNVRPISGFTGAKLTKCGKNLINPTYGGSTVSGVTIAKTENGYYTLNGTCTADGVSVLVKLTLNPGTYTLSHHIAGGSCDNASTGVMQLVKSDTNTFLVNTNMSKKSVSYTFTEATNVWVRLFVKNGATYTNFKVAAQLELGSIATEYEPYQGDTVTANFGQTVYGGTLDWNTGEMVVEWAAIDGGTRNWSVYNDGVQVFLGDGNPAKIYGAFNIISSHYKTSKNALVSQMGDMEINGSQSSNAIFVRDTRYTDPTAFKAAMSGVQICYQLQKPITIQLTPAQITALQGMNNIRCDAGETTVSGRKDILWLTDYLIDRIKALETAIISTGGNV